MIDLISARIEILTAVLLKTEFFGFGFVVMSVVAMKAKLVSSIHDFRLTPRR
jgi:hypothetical protein